MARIGTVISERVKVFSSRFMFRQSPNAQRLVFSRAEEDHFWIASMSVATALSTELSKRLISSKQPMDPERIIPMRSLDKSDRSMDVSQLKHTTVRPSFPPSAFVDSVFPVPAGPGGHLQAEVQ